MSGKLLIIVRSCAQSSKAVSLELDPLPRFVRTFKACMPQARASTKGDAVSGLHRLCMEHFRGKSVFTLEKRKVILKQNSLLVSQYLFSIVPRRAHYFYSESPVCYLFHEQKQ